MPHNAYMKSSYDTSVVTPVDELWAQLTDVDRLVAELPDAGLVRDGDSLTGSLKCKLGATQVTYRIVARATIVGGASKAATIEISGTEARGDGTLEASLTVAANAVGDQTRVELGGDIEATGRGETADARAWARVMETFLTAVLPPGSARPSRDIHGDAPTPVPPPRTSAAPVAVPPSEVAASVEPGVGPSVPTGPIALAAASVIVLVVVARRRRRRRRK
jgi:uncharacterized protein